MRKKRSKSKLWLYGLIILIAAAFLFFLFIPKSPSLKVYFIKDGKLEAVSRVIHERQEPLSLAMFELLRGPSKTEIQSGYSTELPYKTKILAVSQTGSVLKVTFSRELENIGSGSARIVGLIGQIVYTLTDIPGIEKVRILVEDRNDVVLGGEGFAIDRPLSRDDVKY